MPYTLIYTQYFGSVFTSKYNYKNSQNQNMLNFSICTSNMISSSTLKQLSTLKRRSNGSTWIHVANPKLMRRFSG